MEITALTAEQSDASSVAATGETTPPPMPVPDPTPPPLPVPDPPLVGGTVPATGPVVVAPPVDATPPPAEAPPVAPPAATAPPVDAPPAPAPATPPINAAPAPADPPAATTPPPASTDQGADESDGQDDPAGDAAAEQPANGPDQGAVDSTDVHTMPYTGTPSSTSGTPADQPPPQSKGYWDIDPSRLEGFGVAVTAARFGLAAVQARVARMQGDDYTPQLGTSPVGKQLAKKFDDRLNGAEGLRGLLEEAMRRMDTFIESAEKVRDNYRETEQLAQDAITAAEQKTRG
ncbi:hypothetical protein [Actinokineospora bangkokensis]|uniref:Uncharacterized protein n=1 Tax=Actinokineospora bangkokensis TaxID=1193682 RepID=A0A1Q9LDP7_9PSEU|nr:hypothetical protein [Actinokineospora bangkokensis]OLR90134.1 hypothetical protein BJP25_03940 [Actinokineospora bangkokensis]